MDNLDEVFPDESETATAEQPEVQEEIVETPVEETQQEVVEPEPVVEPQESRHVPINALLDERDKRKALEARIAEYEARQQAAPQPEPIDPYDDPQGFRESLRTELRVELSDSNAREKHGEEAVEAALAWANEKLRAGDPSVAATFVSQRDPVGWLVQQHKRDAFVTQLPTDVSSLDELIEREIAKRGLSASASGAVSGAVPKQAQQPAKVPPRSLANAGNAPSDIRHVASGPLAGVDALFP